MSKYAAVNTDEVLTSQTHVRIGESDERLQEWKTRIKLGFAAAVFVFLLNLCLLVWTEIHVHYADSEGVAVIFSGNCQTARNISIWSHLAINVLSSILLAAGNACMQCLTAPTRSEIDKAHSKRTWLDVGVHTLRNFHSISPSRRFLWFCLALSSFPLHLMYNSVMFEVKVANNYIVATTPEGFITGESWNHTRARCFQPFANANPPDPNPVLTYLQENVKGLIKLDNSACINAYGRDFVSNFANALVITEDPPYSDESIMNIWEPLLGGAEAGSFVCNGPVGGAVFCNSPQDITNASAWVVPGALTAGVDYDNGWVGDYASCDIFPKGTFSVKYCLAQATPDACKIGISPGILAVVLVCNLVKVVCLFWVFWRLNFEPLVTIGDAISSFLEKPDPSTSECGPMSLTEVHSWSSRTNVTSGTTWKPRSANGFGAASKTRWIVCSFLFVLFWIIALILLITGVQQFREAGLSTTLAGLASNGIGRLNVNEMVAQTPQSITGNVILANTPQLLISLLYLLYNDLFTRIHLAAQWSSYARLRKPLRVLNPRKDTIAAIHGNRQRGYYILSLPLRISLPLLVLMMVLHWLVSQSLFLAVIGINDYTNGSTTPVNAGYPVLGLGWSPFALVLSLIFGGLMIVGLWVYALAFRYSKAMPLVRTCSAAISAACHAPAWDTGVADKPVSYGVIESSSFTPDGARVPGHACFTSAPTTPLIDGELYK